MGKLISMKQREANRRSAQRSTGPKTGAGKSIVKWNALKHGLLASAVVLPQEDRAEYERLWAGLVESLQPVGTLEALLVEDIATIYWRRRRAVRAEAAKIEMTMTSARLDVELSQTEIERDEAARDIVKLHCSVAGLQRLGEVFDDVAREIRQDGKLSDESVTWVERYWEWSDEDVDTMRGAKIVPDAAKTELFKSLLALIQAAQKEFRQQRKALEPQEAAIRNLRSAGAGILEDSTGETILRYEGAMDRKLHAAIAQLERLQRQRRGEIVAPAIHVDLTKTT